MASTAIYNVRQTSPAIGLVMSIPYASLPVGFFIMFFLTLEEIFGVPPSGDERKKTDDHLPGCLYPPAVHLRPHHRRARRLLPGIRPGRRHRPDHHPDPDHLRRADQFPPPRHPPLHAGRQPDERRRPYARPGELRPRPSSGTSAAAWAMPRSWPAPSSRPSPGPPWRPRWPSGSSCSRP